MMRSSSRPPNRPSTIVARTYLATQCRDAIYGRRTRPFGRKLRDAWVCLVAFYVRSRMLTYEEVREIAKRMGGELRTLPNGVNPAVMGVDQGLRIEFSRRLVQAARWKEMRRGTVTRIGFEFHREVDRTRDLSHQWTQAEAQWQEVPITQQIDQKQSSSNRSID